MARRPTRRILHVAFRADTHAAIRRRAKAMDQSMSAWVRHIVSAWLDAQPKARR